MMNMLIDTKENVLKMASTNKFKKSSLLVKEQYSLRSFKEF